MTEQRDPIAAFLPKPGGITRPQLRAIWAAAQWAELSKADLAAVIVSATGLDSLEQFTPDDYDRVMDRFVAGGFRHPAVPMLTAAHLACLDDGRRQLGVTGRQFVRLVRQAGGVRSRRHLDGIGFMRVWKALYDAGAQAPMPHAGFMTRRLATFLLLSLRQARLSNEQIIALRMRFGGVSTFQQLDPRAYFRMLAWLELEGVQPPTLAPRVGDMPGMVTQAQANLIWRRWQDGPGLNEDRSESALSSAIEIGVGLIGGLSTLTQAGARKLIDAAAIRKA